MKSAVVVLLLAAQTGSPIFRFTADGFWLNLHHFLYVLGRVEAKMPDIKREAVAGAPADEADGLKGLSDSERARWREAVTAYASAFSKLDLVFDREAYITTNVLRRATEKDDPTTLKIDATVAEALAKAAPIYRRAWWPKHRESNRAWLEAMQDPLKNHGPKILAYLTRAYQEPWMAGGFPVNISAWANWAGAYSTATADSLLVVATMNPGNRGLHGFELTFHEAMHQWDEEIDARLMTIAKDNKLKFNDLLSAALERS